MGVARLPRVARALLTLRRLGHERDRIEEDLHELYCIRAIERGGAYAYWRLLRDALSVKASALSQPLNHAAPRHRHPLRAISSILADVRFAFRLFRRQPGVVIPTVVGLALAIGVTTAVFSVMKELAFSAGGMDDASGVVSVSLVDRQGRRTAAAYADFLQLRSAATTFRPEAWIHEGATLAGIPDVAAQSVQIAFVSGGFFETFGGRSSVGRVLQPSDDTAMATTAAVVNHAFWKARLNADPSVVGRTVTVAGAPVSLVGVAERRFSGPLEVPPAIYLPLAAAHRVYDYLDRFQPTSTRPVSVAARLPAGIELDTARAEAASLVAGMATARKGSTARLEPAHQFTGEDFAIVSVVLTILGLVLLLACANVANLLLASATTRQQEIAARLALGASRARVVRQLVTESLLLGAAAGVIGLWIANALLPLSPLLGLPATYDPAPDLRVFVFVAFVSAACSFVAGLAPARHGTRGDLITPLKAGGLQSSGPPRSGRLRSVFIGIQAAASVLLLVLASLLARALVETGNRDVGFDLDRLVVVSAGFDRAAGTATPAERDAYWQEALIRLRSIPGVDGAALVYPAPFDGTFFPADARDDLGHRVVQARTSPEYFRVTGMKFLAGRTYTDAEIAVGAPVAVITERVARSVFGKPNPIGETLGGLAPPFGQTHVIGVVNDTQTSRLREPSRGVVYRPLGDDLGTKAVVRTAGRPATIAALARQALAPLGQPVQAAGVGDGFDRYHFQPALLLASAGAVVAAFALSLAVIGIFGVTAFVVSLRTREIGVRMAIGATPRDVIRLLVRDALRPVLIGAAAGITLALVATQAIAAILYGGISPRDPIAFVGAAVVLLPTAAIATAIPARRAARIDPAVTLREP